MCNVIELWRIKKVMTVTGLSHSGIYRGMAEGSFPRSRKYKGGKAGVYWRSDEVLAWRDGQLSD